MNRELRQEVSTPSPPVNESQHHEERDVTPKFEIARLALAHKRLDMLETLPEVAARYTQYRQIVYEATAKEFSAYGITLRAITTADAHTADRWSDSELNPERIPVWS